MIIKKKGQKKILNPNGLPNKNFEIEFEFKTKQSNSALFSIENPPKLGGGHDRHIYLKGGKLHHRVWPGKSIKVSNVNFADGNWHKLSLVSEKG